MAPSAEKAELLRSLHVPGDPLILVNVRDSVTARVVAAMPGVKALATASRPLSETNAAERGAVSFEQTLEAASAIVTAVRLPVSVDVERGYPADSAGLERDVANVVETGAAGLTFEDSREALGVLYPVAEQVRRIAAVRRTADRLGVPLVINARVDALPGGGSWYDAVRRANAYLEAGADCAFVLGLTDENSVGRAVTAIHGPVAAVTGPTSVPLRRLAELGVARIGFGPGPLRLALAHLRAAAGQLTFRGEAPPELAFPYWGHGRRSVSPFRY